VADEDQLDEDRQQEILRMLGVVDSSTGVVVVPTSRQGDIGIYDEGVDELVKDLSRDGIVAAWADDPRHRRTRGRKSADVVISAILSFPFGVAGNAAWYAILNWLPLRLRRANDIADFEFFRQTRPDGSTLEHLKYFGPASEVVKLMQQVPPPALPPSQADG
jgi:hypothetical protein